MTFMFFDSIKTASTATRHPFCVFDRDKISQLVRALRAGGTAGTACRGLLARAALATPPSATCSRTRPLAACS